MLLYGIKDLIDQPANQPLLSDGLDELANALELAREQGYVEGPADPNKIQIEQKLLLLSISINPNRPRVWAAAAKRFAGQEAWVEAWLLMSAAIQKQQSDSYRDELVSLATVYANNIRDFQSSGESVDGIFDVAKEWQSSDLGTDSAKVFLSESDQRKNKQS